MVRCILNLLFFDSFGYYYFSDFLLEISFLNCERFQPVRSLSMPSFPNADIQFSPSPVHVHSFSLFYSLLNNFASIVNGCILKPNYIILMRSVLNLILTINYNFDQKLHQPPGLSLSYPLISTLHFPILFFFKDFIFIQTLSLPFYYNSLLFFLCHQLLDYVNTYP